MVVGGLMTLGLRWPSVSRPFSLGAGIVFLVGVKTLHATSLQCRNATVYGLITTAAHGMSIPPASTTSPNPSRTLLILKPGASQSRKRSGTCMVLHLLLLLWRWVRQQPRSGVEKERVHQRPRDCRRTTLRLMTGSVACVPARSARWVATRGRRGREESMV